ncbi:hypothetical protein [Mucilaginibacter gilvus]|uniref:Uncharacterized protein n=1 Tax=Mucilaginibacter gilvus TaxID=2305909 RepID=A0A3S3VIQ6_9SPHI|nr:hypothetical protein [Mucilaginibacter gilvus]RWY54319.1 hypothetical protein EPL05_09800 [Mucilaginibacter gilvus]
MLKNKLFPAIALSVILLSFRLQGTLSGTYVYAGGVYNGKAGGPSKDYKLQRRYTDSEYEATFIEPGQDTIVYEQGKYTLEQDTCLETQTYSREPSKTLNISVRYVYHISNDTLSFSGLLPNGTTVQEYWKKVKP